MTASSVCREASTPKRKLEISFGGCGFLGVYHVGVGKCVVDHVPHLFDEFSGFYGASAGAITAVCAACKSDPMVPYKWVKKTFEASREHRLLGALHPSFNLYARLREFLEGFLPEDAHKKCRNKVKISMTTFDETKTIPEPKNWLVSNFTTRKELINVSVKGWIANSLASYCIRLHSGGRAPASSKSPRKKCSRRAACDVCAAY